MQPTPSPEEVTQPQPAPAPITPMSAVPVKPIKEEILGNNQHQIMNERHLGHWVRQTILLLSIVALIISVYYGYQFAIEFMNQSVQT